MLCSLVHAPRYHLLVLAHNRAARVCAENINDVCTFGTSNPTSQELTERELYMQSERSIEINQRGERQRRITG